MPQINSELLKISRPTPRIYTKEELQKFGNDIQKFYEEYTIETGKDIGNKIIVLNYEKLSQAFGATDKNGAVILTGFGSETNQKGETIHWYDRPSRQEKLQNTISQYYWYKDGQDWAENKKIEALSEMSKQISQDKTKIPDDMEEAFNNF